MTRGLLLAADDVADVHLEYAYHRLREDAVLVDVAAPDGGEVRTDRGGTRAAVAFDDLPPARRYDLVVVPGGGAANRLADDEATRRWVGSHLDAGGVVCAIADGVQLLLALDVLDGRLVAAPGSLRDDLEAAGARATGEAVTVDGPLVTVRDTESLPFGVAATLDSVVIPQDPASEARERPHWGETDAA